jgi:hypothetical protein
MGLLNIETIRITNFLSRMFEFCRRKFFKHVQLKKFLWTKPIKINIVNRFVLIKTIATE